MEANKPKKDKSARKRWYLSDKKLTLKKLFSKKNLAYALVWAIVLTTISYLDPLANISMMFEDSLYQDAQALDGEIIVFGIDEKTLDALGPFTSWGRSGIADALTVLNSVPEEAPAAIGLDCLFFGYTTPEIDQKLVDAAALADNEVFATSATIETELYIDEEGVARTNDFMMTLYEIPYPELMEVTTTAHINSMPDVDGNVRSYIQQLDLPEEIQEETGLEVSMSFAYTILEKYNTYWGLDYETYPEFEPNPPLNFRYMFEIPYYGEPGAYGDGYSLIDLINGEIDPYLYSGKMVLIGPFAAGMQDAYSTPISPVPMHGIEIHANAIEAMRWNEYRYRVPWETQMVALFVIIFALYFVFRALNIVLASVVMILINGAYVFMCRALVFPPDFLWGFMGLEFMDIPFLFLRDGHYVRIMLEPLYLLLAVFVLFVVVVVANFFVEQKARNQLSNVFKKYLDPRVVERMNEEGFNLESLSSQRIIASVLFVDIRGFTPFSEPLEPMQVVDMLRDYLTLTSGAVHKYEGFLDKFIGDATMAVFNAPLPQDNYAYKSVLAAWEISYNGSLKVPEQVAQYGRSVMPGIGLNMGPIIFGNIGSDSRKDLTAIGDTVNTAARFESVARRGQVLMNEVLYEAVKDKVIVRYHGEMELKGKSIQPKTYALEQVVEYIGKFPPLPSGSVPPGKGALDVGYDFESAPRHFPEHFTEEQKAAHLEEVYALREQLEIDYETKPKAQVEEGAAAVT